MAYNNRKAIWLAIICTIFTSVGQVLWKLGLAQIEFTNLWTLINVPFIFGFISYGLGAIFMLLAFKYGELSLVYPFIAASYVWVILLSLYLFSDVMNWWKWLGVIIIILSVCLLGYGSSKKEKIGVEQEGKTVAA
ncbi:MAG: EamA family transporter [Nanoarchaeota archaeon]